MSERELNRDPTREETESKTEYINFGGAMRGEIPDRQTQHLYYLLKGIRGEPNLGEGLRVIESETGGLHDVQIHPDDVGVFIQRYRDYASN